MENNINNESFSFDMPKGNSSIIKVIGVGGGGNNALKHMFEKGINGVDFIIFNTDQQTLDNNPVPNKIQLGISTTEGLGAGADPEVGEKAALESIDDIKNALGVNTKMVFITAGMGGGTGTGAAPIIAKAAKEMGILTVAIVTIPFSYEGKRRLDQAEQGLAKLRENIDSLIVVNNDKLRQQYPNLGFKEGFQKANEVLTNSAKGMAEVITGYFEVNIDFRDAKTVLQNSGTALMSTGMASGDNRAEEAVRKALDSPLLNDNKITGAKNVLLLIRSDEVEATMDEIGFINDYIQKESGNTADIIFGVGSEEDLGENISVLVIATGFSGEEKDIVVTTEKIVHKLDDHAPAKVITQNQVQNPFQAKIEETPSPTRDDSKHVIKLDDFDFQPEGDIYSQENHTTGSESFSFLDDDNDPGSLFNDFTWDFEGKNNAPDISPEPTAPNNSINIPPQNDNEIVFKFVDKDINPNPNPNPTPPAPQANLQSPNEIKLSLEPQVVPAPAEAYQQPAMQEIELIEKPSETMVVEEETAPQEEEKTYQVEGFTIVEKTNNNPINEERRNKLQAFNARFDTKNPEEEFENIPAFRRKNIQLDSGEEQNKTQNERFVDFNQPHNPELKENRFLNKDVD